VLTEKITTSIHVQLTGASEAVKLGGILMSLIREIQVRALPLEVPDKIVADIGVLKAIGDSIHVSDLVVPANVEILTAGNVTLATVQAPTAEEAPAAVEAAPVEGAAPAEGAAAAPAADGKTPEKAAEKGKEKSPEKGKKE
jgi:large subunit ribosomal protein L25